ncbi:MAG: HD domain-containing protein [Candidatus Micrarchaeia archaeon]
MDWKLKHKLIEIAKKNIKNDPSHDFNHAMRVLKNAEMLGRIYHADMDVLIPAALFHDLIVYDKGSEKSKYEHEESARMALRILRKLHYNPEKLDKIKYAIEVCSYSKGIKPTTLEAKILQDADRIETGAIGIMRTFSSSGSMGRQLYELSDPFLKRRKGDSKISGLDHLILKVANIHSAMNTKAAIKIARRREKFVKEFIKELELEFKGK